MTKPNTQAERLTRIETLLEGWLENRRDDRAEWATELRKIHDRLDHIQSEHQATNERLSAYENKGKGLLIGVGLFGSGIGATILAVVAKFAEWFK